MTYQPFHQYLGIAVDRAENGEAEGHLELGAHHLNHTGVVHGGVLATLLDATLGAAVISAIPREWWCATISLSVQFLEGAVNAAKVGSGATRYGPALKLAKTTLVTTAVLGKARVPGVAYENADGSPLKLDTDYFGKKRKRTNPTPGPFERPGVGLLTVTR